MDFTEVFLMTLMPLAVALYGLGVILKISKFIKDEHIPLILIGLGIAGALGLMPVQDKYTITEAVIQGVIAACIAVLSNQVYKQNFKKD